MTTNSPSHAILIPLLLLGTTVSWSPGQESEDYGTTYQISKSTPTLRRSHRRHLKVEQDSGIVDVASYSEVLSPPPPQLEAPKLRLMGA